MLIHQSWNKFKNDSFYNWGTHECLQITNMQACIQMKKGKTCTFVGLTKQDSVFACPVPLKDLASIVPLPLVLHKLKSMFNNYIRSKQLSFLLSQLLYLPNRPPILQNHLHQHRRKKLNKLPQLLKKLKNYHLPIEGHSAI